MANSRTVKVVALTALFVMVGASFMIPSLGSLNTRAAVAACVAPQATAWVVDSGNNRVLEFLAPFYSGMSASVVIGEPDFVTSGQGEGYHGGGVTASSLSSPTAVAMDAYGNVWIADSGNNRVLEFTPPFHNGMAASVVLGRSSFTTGADNGEREHQYHSWGYGQTPTQSSLFFPTAIAIDGQGDIWVSDQGNNRIVEFKPTSTPAGAPPQYTNGESATVVIGASDFKGDNDGNWRDTQAQPASIAFDSGGDLWVSDSANNRILEYVPPFTSGMSASVAIGQPTLTTVPNPSQYSGWSWNDQGNGASQSTLSNPFGIAFDSDGNLWVSDQGNNRILEFSPPFKTGMLATQVIGQSSSFTSGSQNRGEGHGDVDSFFAPGQIAFDGSGNLWVTDAQNNRVIVFQPPLWGGSVATMVIGQPLNFQTTSSGVGQNVLDDPNGILVTAPGTNTFKLAWVKQIDPVQQSTIFVTSPPSDGMLSHAFVALSSTPSIYVVRVSDGALLYHSPAFNVPNSQYGVFPNQQFTLSGLGVPLSAYGNSFDIAWVTTSAKSPTSYWLFVASVPVNQFSITGGSTQAISLSGLVTTTGRTINLNPVSVAFTSDGTYILVGGTQGYVAAFVRSCPNTPSS